MLIYGLTDPDGTVRYVGKTKDLAARIRDHKAETKTGDFHRARWIRKLLREGHELNAVILEHVEDGDGDAAERRWIAHHRDLIGKRLTNATEGGEGGALTGEAKQRQVEGIRATFKNGRQGAMKGKKHSAEAKAKMSAAAKRRIERGDSPLCDPEHQRRASARSKKMTGKKSSPETKLKISQASKKQWAERRKKEVARASS